jgi:catechol 2,3-dioxygenase-like lactoylglutathione lyase family enzyme
LPRRREEDAVLDHVVIPVKDFEASRKFYEQVLGTLGAKVVMEWPGLVLLGTDDGMVGISEKDQIAPMHVAFKADRNGVQAFYDAALAAGASDNGAPGVRADIHPNYYAAFVLDPNGHNIEAVCHQPE